MAYQKKKKGGVQQERGEKGGLLLNGESKGAKGRLTQKEGGQESGKFVRGEGTFEESGEGSQGESSLRKRLEKRRSRHPVCRGKERRQ